MRISNDILCIACGDRFDQDRPHVGNYCPDCREVDDDDE